MSTSSFWSRLVSTISKKRRRKDAQLKRRMFTEPLESRNLMATFTVTTTADEFNLFNFTRSLREAVVLANASPSADTISFASALAGQTITLTGGELEISEDVTINGPQAGVTINANNASRVFKVKGGDVAINSLNITGGNAGSGAGGGILVTGDSLSLDNVYVYGNRAGSDGGGIASSGRSGPFISLGPSLTIANSTVAGNVAGDDGGGVSAFGGSLRIVNSTLSGNRAGDEGGGVRAFSRISAAITNSTITGNRANSSMLVGDGAERGGGVAADGITLNNTLIAGNSRGNVHAFATSDDTYLTASSASGYNLIGHAATASNLVDGVNGNIVGNAGVGTLNTAIVLDSNLALHGGRVPTHRLVVDGPAVDSGDNARAVDPSGAALATDQRGISRVLDGEGDGVAVVDIGAYELASPLLVSGGIVGYVENDPAMAIAADALVTDLDDTSFPGGVLTAWIAANADANDRLAIVNEGTGANQIGLSGRYITYGGVRIGSFTGGAGSVPLRVTLNANASQPAVQTLLQKVTFRTLGDTPSTAPRSVQLSLYDAEAGMSNTVEKVVEVTTVNDRPAVTVDPTASYVENDAPQLVAPTATVDDVDSPNFDGGSLRVTIVQNPRPDDRLAFANQGNGAGQIGVVGDDVFYQGVLIGTKSGGVFNTPLVVALNANATAQATQALARAVTFETLGDDPADVTRVVRYVVDDGDGDTSQPRHTMVNVTAVNDAPVITGGGSVGYTLNGPAVMISNTFLMSDPDSANFDGGQLSVSVTGGVDASNRLELGGAFTLSGNDVIRSGVTIGTMNVNGGVGTTNLVITLNANATAGITQQLLRSITFRTQGGVSTAQRTVAFLLTDGDGGTSNVVTKTVNVA